VTSSLGGKNSHKDTKAQSMNQCPTINRKQQTTNNKQRTTNQEPTPFMNLQQLFYIISVAETRSFAKAAVKNAITQPSLSTMVQKLEEELGVKIFDRSHQPVSVTREGEVILNRARSILAEVARLYEFAQELKGEVVGEFHLGIIPTLAPYLLPLFLPSWASKFPQLRIFVREMMVDEIIPALKTNGIDLALMATPLQETQLSEYPLFQESLFVYTSPKEKLPRKKYLTPAEIGMHRLWLMAKGHCLRNQAISLCEWKQEVGTWENLQFEAGSIETLINLVDRYEGLTIIPQLAAMNLSTPQKRNLREFVDPPPAREISLVCLQSFPRKKMLENLRDEIMLKLPIRAGKKKRLIGPF